MRHCTAQDERCASAFRAFKRDGGLACLEDREFTVRQPLAGTERAVADRDPRNGVPPRRFVRPPLTRLERDQQVVNAAWSPRRARCGFVRADDEAGGTNARHLFDAEVLGFWF